MATHGRAPSDAHRKRLRLAMAEFHQITCRGAHYFLEGSRWRSSLELFDEGVTIKDAPRVDRQCGSLLQLLRIASCETSKLRLWA